MAPFPLALMRLLDACDPSALVLGHGSYFFRRQGEIPQDIDVVIIDGRLNRPYERRRVKSNDLELDVIVVGYRSLFERIISEASYGTQFLSRALSNSKRLRGDRHVYAYVVAHAEEKLKSDPRLSSLGFMQERVNNVSLILRDRPRFAECGPHLLYTYIFDDLIALLFLNAREWRTPPSCRRYWHESVCRRVDELHRDLSLALQGDDEAFMKSTSLILTVANHYIHNSSNSDNHMVKSLEIL